MRATLQEWGAVQSVRFMGAAYGGRWMSYPIPQGFPNRMTPTVEVSWNKFEVRQTDATSEWLIAVDRDGRIWVACAGPSPWT